MDKKLQALLTQKPLLWTEHARFKMRQYGLSEARVKRVLRNPVRTEAGIAPRTVAVMQPASVRHSERSDSGVKNPMLNEKSAGSFARLRMTEKRKWSQELWVMYADTKKARKIIAAWRYPGTSPVRQPPPFPEDLLYEDLDNKGKV